MDTRLCWDALTAMPYVGPFIGLGRIYRYVNNIKGFRDRKDLSEKQIAENVRPSYEGGRRALIMMVVGLALTVFANLFCMYTLGRGSSLYQSSRKITLLSSVLCSVFGLPHCSAFFPRELSHEPS